MRFFSGQRDDGGPRSEGPGRPGRLFVGLMVAALAGAVAIPRAHMIVGVELTTPLANADMVGHLENADKMYKLRTVGARNVGDPTLTNPTRWSRGLYYLAQPWVARWGPLSIWTTQLTTLLFTLILLASVIALGINLAGWQPGLWSGLVTALCPPLVASSWYFGPDFPLVGMAMAALLILWRSRGFTRWAWSTLFGVWAALGMLVKLTFVIYIAPVSVWALVYGIRRGGGWRAPVRALAAAVIALGLTFALQDLQLETVWSELVNHVVPERASVQGTNVIMPAWTWAWLTAYLVFAANNFPWPLLLLAAPGLVLLHARPREPAHGMLLTFLWGTLLLLTPFESKMERYLQVVYPVLCICSVLWIHRMVPRRWRMVASIWITASFAGVLWFTFQRPIPWVSGEEVGASTRSLYENAMPTRRDLAAARDAPFMIDQCFLGPAAQGVADLARLGGAAGPLGLPLVESEEWQPLDRPMIFGLLALAANHKIRDRFVKVIEPFDRHAFPRTLVLFHRPAPGKKSLFPEYEARATRSIIFRCEEQHRTMMLTLLVKKEAR